MGELDSDKTLLERIVSGNVQAFTQLHDRYFSDLYRMARQVLPDKFEAKDLVQEILIKIWERPGDFARAENFKAYLYRTGKNCALNALKKSLTEAKARQNYQFEDIGNPTEEYLDRRDLKTVLDKALKMLPPRQAQVYRLEIEKELGYKEIAKQLNTSPKTVQLQLGSARKFVREYLAQHYHHYSLQTYLLFLTYTAIS